MSEASPAHARRAAPVEEDSGASRPTLLPREHLSAYERWELPHVSEDGGGSLAECARGPLTAAQLEGIQRQAYEEAYARGHAEGLGEGRAQARGEVASALEALDTALGNLARPFSELDAEVEAALVALAVSIARQLLFGALDEHPDRVLAAVRAGLQVLPSAERRVRLELHPDDLPIVRDALTGPADGAWELQADPGLTRGGCRITSGASRIDATVEARLESVVAHVLGGSREGGGSVGEGAEAAGAPESGGEGAA